MHSLLVSLLSHLVAPRFHSGRLSVVELGSGDGALSWALYQGCPNISVALLDGSMDMLNGARRRFGATAGVTYLNATFQSIISLATVLPTAHFIVSSLAIHHLTLTEKAKLFALSARSSVPRGAFANIDVVLSPSERLEDWYLRLWADWIEQSDAGLGDGRSFGHIPLQYKQNADNLPDTLQDQLAALRDCGLQGVDVFFKSGVFAVYGGFKPTD